MARESRKATQPGCYRLDASEKFSFTAAIYMMPLDATQLKLDEVKRELLFQHDSPITINL
jgi:hypothetical protein